MIPENIPRSQVDGTIGQQLCRPECAVAHCSGLLLTPDWSGNGGISVIDPVGTTHSIQSRWASPLRPNGIALESGGTVLLAHLGERQGGIYRLYANGDVEPVVRTVEGVPMPPANYVVQDSEGRIWLTVSTRLTPRAADYRASARSGFIAVATAGSTDARIVADGLGYTNECVIDEQRGEVWVNETFARRLTRFELRNTHPVILGNGVCVCAFGAGTYPDGLALDEQGHLWISSIVSNRILRISPQGDARLMFEDSDPAHLAWTEEAFHADALGREHLDIARSQRVKNLSNLAFGGPARQRLFLGNLLGDTLPYIDCEFTGVAMPHWTASLGDLQVLTQRSDQ